MSSTVLHFKNLTRTETLLILGCQIDTRLVMTGKIG